MKRRYKIIAVILSFALITQIFVAFGDPFSWKATAKTSIEDSENQRIAAEISNMTGIEVETILQLRASGKSWNEIIEDLGQSDEQLQQAGKKERNMLLMGSGLSENAIEKLLAEGYEEQLINESKLLAERVVFQLKELLQTDSSIVVDPLEKPQEDELQEFHKVAEQFNVEDAVNLMLKLKIEFGSYESVLDEYLYALQLGLDLENYVQDKESYLEEKQQKISENVTDTIVSLSEIEQQVLKKIQRENARGSEEQADNQDLPNNQDQLESSDSQSLLPDVPMPTVDDKRPVNPTDEITRELETINPNNFEQYE
jgi:hypothetical protein